MCFRATSATAVGGTACAAVQHSAPIEITSLQAIQKAWDMRNLKGQGPRGETEKGYKIPVKKMDVFDGVRFAPECCPSTYSNSVGCACAPGNLERYVAEQRGGNNTKQCGSSQSPCECPFV